MKDLLRLMSLIFYYLFFKYLPGTHGGRFVVFSKFRVFAIRYIFEYCGYGVTVERGAYFGSGKSIRIGDYSGIGTNAYLQGPLEIGKYVMMAPEVVVLTRTHNTSDLGVPMALQGNSKIKPVIIGDDVWIGTRVMIMPGVTIGRGCIVGAGAVVTKDLPEFSICGGVPARVIRTRQS